MQKTAIIAEYNPFHNGHFYQAQTARQETGADVMIAIMSAQFTQRGEPASFDKWKRAIAAVESGAIDLVVELPTKYGVQRADRFATSAVSIAEQLRCQTLSFGSESGDVDAIVHAAQSNVEESPLYKEALHQALQEGHSSAQASSRAFHTVYPSFDLTRPNNILAYHYAKAAKTIQLHTVKRLGADFHDTSLTDVMSATGIRAHYLDTGEVRAVPASTEAMFRTQSMTHWELYWPVLQYKLRTLPLHTLTELVGIDASLAPRLKRAGLETSFDAALTAVSTRRYTRTSIQRAFVSVLLHWLKDDVPTRFDDVPYVRPLAFNEIGRMALRDVKKELPLLSKYDERLDFEARVTEAYRLPLHNDALIEHRQRPQFISSK
ncbi:nucleotidyltransferase family protein [Exiguobacterium aestuarii]|uniref:tRNA(Met) cytidine acetate ligase n=1 Tax=Exiguobacterium aestuarii TaxID=273527 RepID=A0ABW2PLU3_9BACL|nr:MULTISPECIES: nucleotidyltransferase family protein [Exiguobacterium]MCT4787640.1 nucleotidyltransferase family protein [Exiguobacterium aestuarii]